MLWHSFRNKIVPYISGVIYTTCVLILSDTNKFPNIPHDYFTGLAVVLLTEAKAWFKGLTPPPPPNTKKKNGSDFAGDISKCISMNDKFCISI